MTLNWRVYSPGSRLPCCRFENCVPSNVPRALDVVSNVVVAEHVSFFISIPICKGGFHPARTICHYAAIGGATGTGTGDWSYKSLRLG